MISKVLRVNLVAEVMIINDDGEVVDLIETKPLIVFKGITFNYETYLKLVESSTLQAYKSIRFEADKSHL